MPAARAATLALAVALSVACPVAAATLPRGFAETVVADGLTGATAMEIAPDGRIFICEQTGALRVVKGGSLIPTPFVTVSVDSSWERGLLGVALDPAFPRRPYLYLNYTPAKPYPHHRISRFTARGDMAVAESEVILFEGDDQRKLGGGVPNGHQGGALHFGRDGKLYVALGDQTAGVPAQSMKTLQGKILRLNPDGSIPEDNPFYRTAKGKYRAIWALGLRNPFTFAVQVGSGRMFINDVGGANEEINEGVAGANYGWPTADHGPTKDRRFRGPIHWYKESSIAGGAFYNPARPQFPRDYLGKYFFADFKQGWMKTLDPDDPRRVAVFATNFGGNGVVDIKVAADGSLYYLSRRAWVRDKDFKPNTGRLVRVRYTGARTPPNVIAHPAPQVIVAGRTATFGVTAAGNPPLRYQWQRNDADVRGATAAVLELSAVALADSGARFRCVVTNAFGRAVSDPAPLTVRPADRRAAQHTAGTLTVYPYPGTYTGPIRVVLTATRKETIRYTTDGTPPTADSPAYTTPLALDRSVTVQARPFDGPRPRGKLLTVAYTIKGKTPYGIPVRIAAAVNVPQDPRRLPPRLSQTGLFASLARLTPARGVLPYDVNAPLWSDGAAKRRWIVPAREGQIEFAPAGEWTFPAGTVFVKHFELSVDDADPTRTRRLETRLLVVDSTGGGYGATYRWRPDHSDADLLAGGLTEDVTIKTRTGVRKQTWQYPSRADCLSCHTAGAGFVLGVKTRQLNRPFAYPDSGVTDNQLRAWNYLGLFAGALDEAAMASYARLVLLNDTKYPLEQRVRSYLDANCAQCHRPGVTIRAAFDARFDTPLLRQGLLDAPTVSDSLGLVNPRVVAPGAPDRSMLYRRPLRTDHFRMPPLAVHVHDRAALAVIEQWIKGRRAAAAPGRGRDGRRKRTRK